MTKKHSFFTKDPSFYRTLFHMLLIVGLQNLVAYSVNMADNIMLGSYDQHALSGAAAVNQIFFIIQQLTIAAGNALVVLASQYWGRKQIAPIRTLTGITLRFSALLSAVILLPCLLIPGRLLRIFTNSVPILEQGAAYLQIICWTFPLFFFSGVLMAVLRSIGIVNISFRISVVSLIVNVTINYTLIFGHFGFPELGIRGAALGTLIARILELFIILWYVVRDKTLHLRLSDLTAGNRGLHIDYLRTVAPITASLMIWAISVPMQTAILGHLSEGAIAANAVASTVYQYLKVIVVAMSSTCSVLIGNAIGKGDHERIRSDARTLSTICVGIGVVLGIALILIRGPLLSMYQLDDETRTLASHLIVIFGFIMMGMSYQMPVSSGIIQGAGDTSFMLKMNLISVWGIVMPLSFAAAFLWKLPVELVVCCIQSDQVFKCLPTFLKFRRYNWIRIKTR